MRIGTMKFNEITTPSGRRIAQEAQLLAEERWIVDALKKIRTQRNCLQIERLQLENTLTMLKYGPITKRSEKLNVCKEQTPASTIVSEDGQARPRMLDQMSACTTSTYKTDQIKNLDEGVAHFEELNLSVTNPVWSNINDPLNFNVEIEEEDEESEQERDDINIDINMLMNAEQAKDIHMDS